MTNYYVVAKDDPGDLWVSLEHPSYFPAERASRNIIMERRPRVVMAADREQAKYEYRKLEGRDVG